MKPRKEYKPKGMDGTEEKLYYGKGQSFKAGKDYWEFSAEKNKKTEPSLDKKTSPKKEKKKYHYARFALFAFLIGSLLFFLYSIISAVYIFFSGGIFVSPENVIINIVGENTVSAGEEVNLEITVRNRNNANIYNAQLILRYPEEARDPDDPGSRINTQRIDLGDLRADGVKRHNTSFNLFGKEGETYTFVADLTFTFEGSGALYEKGKEFNLRVKDTPVSLELIGPDEVYINGRNEYTVRVLSDADTSQENLIVRIEHPLGFYLSDFSEEISRGLWVIDTLEPGEKKELTFTGMFVEVSADEMSRTISVSVGPADDVVTHFASSEIVADVNSTPFELELSLDIDDHVYFGETVEGKLFWRNSAGLDMEKGYLELAVKGKGLDSLSGQDARREENRLVWTGKEINFSGSEGVIPFSFDTHLSQLVNDRDLILSASFEGDTRGNERVSFEHTKQVLIATYFNVEVITRLSDAGTQSSLVAGETYDLDVTLSVLVGVGGVRNAEIITKFPSSVVINSVSAGDENFRLDSSREFLWRLGEIQAGTGLWRPARGVLRIPKREVVLSVSITPEESGRAPILIEEIHLFGDDRGTGEMLERSFYNIPLQLSGVSLF